MKLLLISLCIAFATADVSHILNKDEKSAAIVKQDLDVSPDGAYHWSFQTDNGIQAQANGEIRGNQENEAQVSAGEASWTAPNGEVVQFQYVADENGYQPQGSHIPTPPPIPAAILRALQYIRDHPPPPEKP